MNEEKQIKCIVRDGRFVDPCCSLESQNDNARAAFSKGKGITRWEYTNMTTLEPSRTFFGVKSKASPNGMLFNFCPWCGEDISAPFASQDQDTAS